MIFHYLKNTLKFFLIIDILQFGNLFFSEIIFCNSEKKLILKATNRRFLLVVINRCKNIIIELNNYCFVIVL